MFRWNLMLRTLFGLRYDEAKAHRAKKTVKLHLERLEDRTVPSALGPNPLGFETVASPPPVSLVATLASPAPAPSVAVFTSSVFAMMDHWFQFVATAEQEFVGDLTLVTQEFAQLESSVRQQVGRFLGNNSHAGNPALNTTVTQPGNDIGMGRGNSSGSGSGKGAMTTANNSPHQPINQTTQQTGRGSGSGSSSTTNHPIATAHGGIVHPMTSGTGSGTGSGASGSGTGSAGGGGSGSGYAIVGGKLWLDNDGDGSWDNGELGYSGATVELMSASMQPYSIAAVATTGSDGSYVFPRQQLGPSPQPFFVHVVLPGDFTDTLPGTSEINNADNSSIFLLGAGGWRKIEAGLLAMNVNTTADHPPNQPIQDKVTLRDAIETGNDGGGPLDLKTITFYDVQEQEELSGTITLQSALDPIKRSYDIYYEPGVPGVPGLTVDGNKSAGTIFTVNEGVTSTISNLTIKGGYVQAKNGGGISNAGTLTLSGDNVTKNTAAATSSGDGHTVGGTGGGIYNSSDGTLTLSGTNVTGNTAAGGGGIVNYGTLTTTAGMASQIADNIAMEGGGIANLGSAKILSATTIKGNFASEKGGGVFNSGNLTISGSARTSEEIYTNRAASGGGIYVANGTLTLNNYVTFNTNKATSGDGGGMYLVMGTTTNFNKAIVTGNTATGKGPGVAYQADADMNGLPAGLTDKDDPDGKPVPV